MFEIDRRQVLVYVAVAAAILVIGVVSLKHSAGGGQAESGGQPVAAGVVGQSESAGSESFIAGGSDRPVVVDVSGAVGRPGVYRLPDGSRVVDAIRKAGGPVRGADVQGINRAARLTDGQQVVVPARVKPTLGAAPSAGGTGSATGSGPVSLGTATATQLEEIDGIGPVTARKIIEYRESKGGLGSVEDLDQVSGIGPVTMESLRSALQP